MTQATRSVYTPTDFVQWRAANCLSLTPKFQRRGVWKPAARSFFIDTLLRGMPVPPVYIRTMQSPNRDRIIREVIDGQQRISAVLDYIDGEYRLSKSLRAPWASKSYSALAVPEQDRVMGYAFSAEVFQGISDLEVLEIFSRLNTYSVKLNAQELRNGRYFGPFKQTMYGLAHEHLEFWRRHGAFTERAIARMLEVEFVSEIVIAFLAGMQDKKKSIDEYYLNNDEQFTESDAVSRRFREVADSIGLAFSTDRDLGEFKRTPLFYSLFCAVYHRRYGLQGVSLATPKKSISVAERLSLSEAVAKLSDVIAEGRAKQRVAERYQEFVAACLTQTDNLKPRQVRLRTLYRMAFGD